MAENSGIEWTDNTLNFWIGCTNVSPACDHCYAETWAQRYKSKWPDAWNGKRYRTSPANWNQLPRWEKKAAIAGQRTRVFSNSLSDFFDNQVPPEWRAEAWRCISVTAHLDFLLLTKRPQNISKMLPHDWGQGYSNVWLGTTIENKTELQRRAPILAAVPATLRFWSVEPLLEDLGDLSKWHGHVDWMLVGGESGPRFRPMDPEWARSIRDQCQGMGIPFFMKQMSGRTPKKVPIPSDLLVRQFPNSLETKNEKTTEDIKDHKKRQRVAEINQNSKTEELYDKKCGL